MVVHLARNPESLLICRIELIPLISVAGTLHYSTRTLLLVHVCFSSGWVQTVYWHSLGTRCLLKAKVKPSQRLSDSPHEAWVALEKSGSIITAHCTCMAATSFFSSTSSCTGWEKCVPMSLLCYLR